VQPARALFQLRELSSQAAQTCLAHPLRSGLGTLAVAVAVGTLVLVHTTLDGLTLFAQRSAARAFGSDTFVLAQVAASGRVSRRELARMLERNPPLRRADLRFLEAHADGRAIYAPTVQRGADVTAGSRKFERAYLMGTGPALVAIRDLGIARGRFFSEAEERRAAQVAVIGDEIVAALFPGQDALGRTIRVGGRGFQVIGVQGKLGSSGGMSLDRYVYVPLPAYERIYGSPATLSISARAPEGLDVLVAEDRAWASLRARRSLAPGEPDNFDLLTPEAARSFVVNLATRIGAAATPISAMALLAAIVVVTNTTLVSVTQRTREIGVRRAIGATRFQVIHEVLAESALVSFTGGAVGLLVVVVAARLASVPLGLELSVSGRTAVVALAHAAGAGLLAGYYPARRAAHIDVIAALRIE
jgi:putative ABC transport system permease protein